MKLDAALRNAPVEKLESIGEYWGLDVPERGSETEVAYRRQMADYLEPRLQSPKYFRQNFERLSDGEQRTMHFLAMHGGIAECDEICTRCFDEDSDACIEVLDSLASKGFAFTENWPDESCVVTLPVSFLRILELPAHRKGYLGQLLQQLPDEHFEAVATRVLNGASEKNEPHIAKFLVRERLLDPKFLRSYLASLSQDEQDVFFAVLRRRGSCLYREALEHVSQNKLDHSKADHINSLIAASGLIYVVAEGPNKYTNLLLIPRDIAQIVASGFSADDRPFEELDASTESLDDESSVVLSNSGTLLRDIAFLAGFLKSQPAKRLTSGGISKVELRRSQSSLSRGKTARYPIFLATFFVSSNLIIDSGDEWTVSERLEEWLKHPEKCLIELMKWWQETSDWSEETADGSAFVTDATGGHSVNLLELRGLVAESVASAPADKWTSFQAFCEALLPRLGSIFSRSGTRAGTNFGKSLRSIAERIIGESMHWLGLVDVAVPPENHSMIFEGLRSEGMSKPAPRARGGRVPSSAREFRFRPTPLGQKIFSLLASGESEATAVKVLAETVGGFQNAQFLVQPTLEIMLPPDLELHRAYQLSIFTETRRVDVATIVEITRDAIRRAMEHGIASQTILEILTEGSRTPLPETVKHLVADCASKYGEVRIGAAGAFLQVSDSVVLQELVSNKRLKPYILFAAGENTVLLAPDSPVAKLVKELKQAGFMPRLDSSALQQTGSGDFHLKLSLDEVSEVLAAMRLVRSIEETLHVDITRGKAASLAEKLKPDGATFPTIQQFTETASKSYEKRFRAALEKQIEDVEGKYKEQVSRLVARKTSSRIPGKYHFKGPNPATETENIREMLAFAQEYELEVETLYVRQNEQEVRLTLLPRSIEGNRVYAHCVDTGNDSIYALERILRAKLL